MRSATFGALVFASLVVSVLASPVVGEPSVAAASRLDPLGSSVVLPASVLPAGWTNLANRSPPRAGHGFVYDAAVGRFILFGGTPNGATFTNATWTYDAATDAWTNVSPSFAPSPRQGMGIAYDARAQRVIVFGGEVPGNASGETWIYDGMNDTWTRALPAVAPEARAWPSMAYDAAADRTILFGGLNAAGPLGDTWAYDYANDTWTWLNATGPSARFLAPMTSDPDEGGVLLFGGAGSMGSNGALAAWKAGTWSFDFGNRSWRDRTPTATGSPSARGGASLAFDPLAGRAVLFGGEGNVGNVTVTFNDTWVFDDARDAWYDLGLATGPSPRLGAGMGFDPAANRLILDGGSTASGSPLPYAAAFADGAVPPWAPQSLAATPGAGRVTLMWRAPSWDGGAPVTNYTIYRGTGPGAEAAIATIGNATRFTDTTVLGGVTFYYEVSAANGVGEGPRSGEANATPGPGSSTPPPPAPGPDTTPPAIAITSPAANSVVSTTLVEVAGTARDDVAVARVDLSTDGSNWTQASGTASWSGNVSLVPGANTILVRAVDPSGNVALAKETVTVVETTQAALSPQPMLLLLVFVVLVAAVVAVVLDIRRREREWEPPR